MTEQERKPTSSDAFYDVIVIGAGTAGVVAALQTAREHISTLLVEKSEMPGGTVTLGQVDFPGLFHAWTKQVIAGIGWELVEKTVREADGEFPDFSKQEKLRQYAWQVRISAPLYALECEEAMREAGVTMLYSAMCAAVTENEDEKTVTLCTKEGLRQVRCRVLIDCSGDAVAVRLAGYPLDRAPVTQPATYRYRMTGYDGAKIDRERVMRDYEAAVAAGTLKYGDSGFCSTGLNRFWIGEQSLSGNHIYCEGMNAADAEAYTEYNVRGRLSILRAYRFLKKEPGFEKLRISELASQCGIRESVRIQGKETVTEEEYLAGKIYEDAVCYAYYPIDIHQMDGSGVCKKYLDEGKVATVPRGALLPRGSRNLLAAGRTIASDHAANSALRVEAVCMATGQAAGALAVLAVRNGTDVAEVRMADVRALLKKHGAIVPEG